MLHFYILLAAVVVAFIAIVALRIILAKSHASEQDEAYYLRRSVFTPAERTFLGVLERLDLNDYRILAKVRLADILGVKSGRGWQAAFNRVSAKHVDFLLVTQDEGIPVLGIELDDSSHDKPDRKNRDKFVDAAFTSAKLPLVHMKVRQAYEAKAIEAHIRSALHLS